MEIEVNDRKLKAALENDALCQRRFGKPLARYIRLRMDALDAASSLHDFWPPKSKPERVHELIGQRKGVFSIDLQQPYRLLFKPLQEVGADDSEPQERWRSVTIIEILGVEDTHG